MNEKFDPEKSYGNYVTARYPTSNKVMFEALVVTRENRDQFIPEQYRAQVKTVIQKRCPVYDEDGTFLYYVNHYGWKYSPEGSNVHGRPVDQQKKG